jgi:hypothetical protein
MLIWLWPENAPSSFLVGVGGVADDGNTAGALCLFFTTPSRKSLCAVSPSLSECTLKVAFVSLKVLNLKKIPKKEFVFRIPASRANLARFPRLMPPSKASKFQRGKSSRRGGSSGAGGRAGGFVKNVGGGELFLSSSWQTLLFLQEVEKEARNGGRIEAARKRERERREKSHWENAESSPDKSNQTG